MKGKFGNLVFVISLFITASSLVGCGKGPALMLPSDLGETNQAATAPSAPSTTTAVGEAEDGLGNGMTIVHTPATQATAAGMTLVPGFSNSMYLLPTLEGYSVPQHQNDFLMLVFNDPADKLTSAELKAALKIRKKQMINGNPAYLEANSFISCAEQLPDNTKPCAVIESQTLGSNVAHQWSNAPFSYEIILEQNTGNFKVADSIMDEVLGANGIDFNFPSYAATIQPHPQATITATAQLMPAYSPNNATMTDDD